MRHRLPESVVREDQQLEASVESASKALAWLRWHWTLDESNPENVSFRAYAQAIGRSERTVRRYARGYVLRVSSADVEGRNMTDIIALAGMSEDKAAAVEAVSDTRGVTPNYAWSGQAPEIRQEVREVQNAVENEAERREEKNEPFFIEERQDYAKKVAEAKKRTREREAREREESRKKHNARFFEADTVVGSVRRHAKEAFDLVEGVEFTEEEVELLKRQLDAAEHMIRLLRMRITGESGVDWDAELAELEEKRQYG